MRTSSIALLLLPLLLIILSTAADAAPSRPLITGEWKPIEDLNDPHVLDIANFAVAEYNKKSNSLTKIGLSKVVKGDTQVVNGTNYKLVLLASDGKNYEAVVWEDAGEHSRHLSSFNPVPN